MKEKEQSNLNHVIASDQRERRNRKVGEIRRQCDYDGTFVPRNDVYIIPTPCGRGSGCARVYECYNHRGGVHTRHLSWHLTPHPVATLLPSPTRGEGAYLNNSGNSQSLINSNHFTHLTHSTHFTHLRKRPAFTLAETLITLAVIGIVAAMTIPNLVQSYKKKEVETKLVKFYSMMNNAIKMAEVDYGPQSTWTDYHINHNVDNENNQYLYDKGDKYDILIKKYFEPYLKITSSENFYDIPVIDKGVNQPQRIYYLPDGSAFSFGLHENREIFFYPFDPKKCLKTENPNGKCRFEFVFIPCDNTKNGNVTGWFPFNIGNGMQPSARDLYDKDELSLKNDSTFGCYNSKAAYSGSYCCALIQRNNWKIPEDYPYKF